MPQTDTAAPTDGTLEATARLHWLCNELAHGNSFSPSEYHKWARQAETALARAGK